MELLGGGGGSGGGSGDAHVAVSLSAPWSAAPAARPLPPGHQMMRAPSCALSLFLVATVGVVPALVLAAIEASRAYLLLFLGQAVIAVGALEWSWLAFRMRRKLLFTLHVRSDLQDEAQEALISDQEIGEEVVAANGEAEEGGQDEATLVMQRRAAMRATQCAVSAIADRFCCGQWVVAALGIALCGTSAALAAVYWMEVEVFKSEKSVLGCHMLVSMTVAGIFTSLLLGCLAPTLLDALVLVIYMSCFIASSMNSFLMYYAEAIGSTELLDALFVLLVGACAVFVLRVVSSKVVMESLLLVLCDILGLAVIVAPMLMAADFVDHPGAERNRDKIALFFIVMFASEIGRWVTQLLMSQSTSHSSPPSLQSQPQAFLRRLWCCCSHRRCQRDDPHIDHTLKNEAISSSGVEELFGAIALGALMLPLSLLWGHRETLSAVEAVVLLLALALGQWSRFLMASVRQMADVTTSGFYLPPDAHVGGVLDRTAVFMVAVIVYHPYVKHVLFA